MDLIRLLEEGARMVLIERQMPSSDLISKIVSKVKGARSTTEQKL